MSEVIGAKEPIVAQLLGQFPRSLRLSFWKPHLYKTIVPLAYCNTTAMMNDDDVAKLANLARLKLNPAESAEFTRSLGTILDYVKLLDRIDTSEVQPMSHVHGVTNVFREDKMAAPLPTELALKNAPDVSGCFIRVPIIIEQEVE
jgi:aspartyl-tRNA(Asn)/glutamyl-tRNA(Gln) amidotransferase subunit C